MCWRKPSRQSQRQLGGLAILKKQVIEGKDRTTREIQPIVSSFPRNELRRASSFPIKPGLNGKHAAMMKTLALTEKQYRPTVSALNVRNDPDALRLYARFRAMRANQMSAGHEL